MPTQPERVGLSAERLRRIERHFTDRYIGPGKLPGTLTLVWRRGQIAYLGLAGQMDVERGRPIAQDTIFRIYSMTKPVTSVAFMMLVEEGLVALDDPVHKYIPSWQNLGVFQGGTLGAFRTARPARPMLILDLLRHTSGLTYGFQQRTNVDAAYRKAGIGELAKSGTLDSMIDGLADMPLEFSPGTAWNYSVSTDVLGFLIGKISGQPFEEFLHARLFRPLGMVDTDFFVPTDKAERLAACYAFHRERKMILQDDPEKSTYLEPPAFISGGGGLVSTVADYLQFCRMLIAGGTLDGVQYVSPKTLELMTLNHLPGGKDLPELSLSLFSESSYAGMGFGLGFSVSLDTTRTLLAGSPGDFAWGGAASTYFWIDPREDLIVIFMTQLMPSQTYSVRRELRTLVYSAFKGDE